MVAFSRRQRLIKDRYTKHLFFVKKKEIVGSFFDVKKITSKLSGKP